MTMKDRNTKDVFAIGLSNPYKASKMRVLQIKMSTKFVHKLHCKDVYTGSSGTYKEVLGKIKHERRVEEILKTKLEQVRKHKDERPAADRRTESEQESGS